MLHTFRPGGAAPAPGGGAGGAARGAPAAPTPPRSSGGGGDTAVAVVHAMPHGSAAWLQQPEPRAPETTRAPLGTFCDVCRRSESHVFCDDGNSPGITHWSDSGNLTRDQARNLVLRINRVVVGHCVFVVDVGSLGTSEAEHVSGVSYQNTLAHAPT